jgi:hypothetical protein
MPPFLAGSGYPVEARMRKIPRPLSALAFFFLCGMAAYPCTIFTAYDGNRALFAGNEDQNPNSCYFVVDKSGKYGVVYFATPWQQWPLVMQTGVNEKGLCYDSNWIPEEKIARRPGKKAADEWTITLLMKECSTVEEVLAKAFDFDFGTSVSYQVHFADATGDAAVIHPRDGKMTYTRKARGKGYLISTNFNLSRLQTGTWSCWRYYAADMMLSEIEAKDNLSVESMASVLAATHQEGYVKTLYSTLYDLGKGDVYLYYDRDFASPYVLNVKSELARSPSYRQVDLKDLVAGMQGKRDGR